MFNFERVLRALVQKGELFEKVKGNGGTLVKVPAHDTSQAHRADCEQQKR